MKVIFLDLDGVMIPMWDNMCDNKDYAMTEDNKWRAEPFSSKSVSILNEILLETGAEIVLSSDWRNNYTLSEMREIFTSNGVIKGPIAYTFNSRKYVASDLEGGRATEIREWVDHHKLEYWVAIDDLNMFELKPHFVHCYDVNEGIKKLGIIEKVISILNKPSEHSR